MGVPLILKRNRLKNQAAAFALVGHSIRMWLSLCRRNRPVRRNMGIWPQVPLEVQLAAPLIAAENVSDAFSS